MNRAPILERTVHFLAKPWRKKFQSFGFRWIRYLPGIPLPFRLPFGAWWLLENDFKKFAAIAAPISLLGFMVVDDEEELGEVCEVIEQPHQVLCKIMLNGKEALIPVHGSKLTLRCGR